MLAVSMTAEVTDATKGKAFPVKHESGREFRVVTAVPTFL